MSQQREEKAMREGDTSAALRWRACHTTPGDMLLASRTCSSDDTASGTHVPHQKG